jgi:hypothetical protein
MACLVVHRNSCWIEVGAAAVKSLWHEAGTTRVPCGNDGMKMEFGSVFLSRRQFLHSLLTLGSREALSSACVVSHSGGYYGFSHLPRRCELHRCCVPVRPAVLYRFSPSFPLINQATLFFLINENGKSFAPFQKIRDKLSSKLAQMSKFILTNVTAQVFL